MFHTRAHLLIATRIALFAMLMAAFAPTLARVMPVSADDGARWFELCTGSGVEWVMVDGDVDENVGREAHSGSSEHCPFCKLAAETPVLIVATSPVELSLQRAAPMPTAFLRAPRTLFAWTVASPRAPPLIA